jgi:rod shape-determining protein MreB and related proteins
MVINMGGGTTELAVISLGGVVYQAGMRMGGDDFEESIINYIRRQHGLLIGERSAERLKIEAGNALPNEVPFTIEVSGQKFPEGVPRSVTLSSTEIYQALIEPVSQVSDMLKLALEKTPAELAADLAQTGIVMTGGGAQLKNLDKLLMAQTGLPIRIADEPLTCVVKGCSMVLENMSKYQSILAEEE